MPELFDDLPDAQPASDTALFDDIPSVEPVARRPIERTTFARGQRTTQLPPPEPFKAPEPATTAEIFADIPEAQPLSPEAKKSLGYAESLKRLRERKPEVMDALNAANAEHEAVTASKMVNRAGLAIGEAGGNLQRMGGGVLGSPLMKFLGALNPVLKPLTGETRKEAAKRMQREGRETAAKYREMGQDLGGDVQGDIVQALTSVGLTSAPGIPAAVLGGLPAAATAAGLQSFGSTYSDQIDGRVARGASREEAERQALWPALASFAVTTTVTAGFGRTGIEAISKGLTAKTVSGMLREARKQAGLEAAEETIDQEGQDIIERLTLNPDKPVGQTIQELFLSGTAGGLLGGGVNIGAGSVGVVANQAQKFKRGSRKETLEAVRNSPEWKEHVAAIGKQIDQDKELNSIVDGIMEEGKKGGQRAIPIRQAGELTTPLFRGTTRDEWESLRGGESAKSPSGSWVIADRDYAAIYTGRVGANGVLIEYKPEANSKVKRLTDDPGDKRLMGQLELGDVAKVYDNEGNVIYDAAKGDATRPEVKTDNLYVTVNAPQPLGEGQFTPAWFQIDEKLNVKGDTRSGMAKVMQESGMEVPDFSKLPQGQYPYAKAVEMLKETAKPAKKYVYKSPYRPVMSISQSLPQGWELIDANTFSVPKPLPGNLEENLELEPQDPKHPKNIKKQYDAFADELRGTVDPLAGTEFTLKDGQKLLLTENIAPNEKDQFPFRITRLLPDGTPAGHQTHRDFDEVIRTLWGSKDDIAETRVVKKSAEKQTQVKPTPEAIYDAALKEARTATKTFRVAQESYRARKIGDQEFLAAKAAFDKSQREFDTAETDFIDAKNKVSQQALQGDVRSPPQAQVGKPEPIPAASPAIQPKATTPAKATKKAQKKVTQVAKAEDKRSAQEIKDELVERLQIALQKAPSEAKEGDKITVEIPEDGTFVIANSVEAISQVLARAKRIKVKDKPPGVPKKAIEASSNALREGANRQAEARREAARKLSAEPVAATQPRDPSFDSILQAANGDSQVVLEHIAKNSKNKGYRNLAKKLLDAGVRPRIRQMPYAQALAEYPDIPSGSYEGLLPTGVYDRNLDLVIVYSESPNAEKTILHEMMHAGTVHGLINDDKFHFEIVRLFQLADKPEGAKLYGLSNEYEFVAEAWTNPEFQKYLSGIKDGSRSLWQRFKDLLRRLFGLTPKDTVLEAVLTKTKLEPSGVDNRAGGQAPTTFQSLVESGPEADRALVRSISRGVPAQAAERALIGAQVSKPLFFIEAKVGPLGSPATAATAAQLGVDDLLDIHGVLGSGAVPNDYEALKAASPSLEYLKQAALEAAVRFQVFKDRLTRVDPASPAHATAQSILADPEFTRYENIVNRDAGLEARPSEWKRLYYGEVEGKITVPLPNGTSVEVALVGDQAAFSAERTKLENAYNDWLAWKAGQDALPDDARSPYYQFWTNHMRWMEEVLLTSRVTNPPSLVTPSNLAGKDIGAWDMIKFLVDDLATRIGGPLRVTAENFTLIRKFAMNLQQKHHATYALSMLEAARSMGFTKGRSNQEGVVMFYDEVMRAPAALAQNPEYQLYPGKLVGKGYALTKEAIRALRLQSKIASEGFDIVQYKVPARRPGLSFTPIIEDTFMGVQWYGRSLKTNANTLTWHGFNQRALDFVASFIATNDPAVRSAKLEWNYDLLISYLTNRQSVLRLGESPFEAAYKVVGEALQAEFAAGTLSPAQQHLTEIVNRVAAASGVSAADVRTQMETELTGLLTAFHSRMGEPDPTVNMRSASETNSFTARRHDQTFPDYFNQYGWRTAIDFLSFIHRIHSYSFEQLANGMAQAMQDLQRQRAEFTAQYQQKAKVFGISEPAAKKQVSSRNKRDLLNGTTYDRIDSIDKKIRQLQRNIDGMMSIYGRKGRTEDMDFRTLMRMSRLVIGGILTGLSTTIRNGVGLVYLGKTVGALRRNAVVGSFDAAWHIVWDGLAKHGVSLGMSVAKAAIVGPVEGIKRGSIGAGYAAALKSIVEGTYRRLETYGNLDQNGLISATNAIGDFTTRLSFPATSGLIVDEDRGIINRTVLGTLGFFDAFLMSGFAKHLFPKLGDSIINAAGMQAARGIIQHHETKLRQVYQTWKDRGLLNTRYDLANPNNPINRLTVQEVFPAWLFSGRSRQKLAMLEQYFEGSGITLQQAAIQFFQQLEAGNPNATLLNENQTTGFVEQLLNEINIATATNRPWWTVKHGLYALISPLMGWNLSTLRGFFKTFSRPGVAPGSTRALLWATVILTVLPMILLLNVGQGLGVEELLRLIAKHVTGMERATRLPWEHDTDKKKALSLAMYAVDPIPFLTSATSFALSDMPNRANADLTPVLLAKTKDLLNYAGGVIQTGDIRHGLPRLARSFFPIAEGLINRLPGNEGTTEALAARRLLTRFGPSELLQNKQIASSGTGTPLSPILNRMLNASMAGGDAEFMRLYDQAVETARGMGKANPEIAVRQAFQARNPYSRAYKQQLTGEQRQELLDRLSPDQRALLEGVENKFSHSAGLLGGTANFARQVSGSRGGVNATGSRLSAGSRPVAARRSRLGGRFGMRRGSRRRVGRGRLSRGLSGRRTRRRRGLRRGLRV